MKTLQDNELKKAAEEWLDKYLSKKLRKSSSEYNEAVRSYKFVLNKLWEFATNSKKH